jgi:hypothetical protein
MFGHDAIAAQPMDWVGSGSLVVYAGPAPRHRKSRKQFHHQLPGPTPPAVPVIKQLRHRVAHAPRPDALIRGKYAHTRRRPIPHLVDPNTFTPRRRRYADGGPVRPPAKGKAKRHTPPQAPPTGQVFKHRSTARQLVARQLVIRVRTRRRQIVQVEEGVLAAPKRRVIHVALRRSPALRSVARRHRLPPAPAGTSLLLLEESMLIGGLMWS